MKIGVGILAIGIALMMIGCGDETEKSVQKSQPIEKAQPTVEKTVTQPTVEAVVTQPSYDGTYELISKYPDGGTELMVRKNTKSTDETYYDIQIVASMGTQSGGIDEEGLPFETNKIYSVTSECSYEIVFSDTGAKFEAYEGDCSHLANGLPVEGEYKKISNDVEW
ncbi:MAG: hypothetical protein K0U38_07560 [Epsilonproteobacteria bacterium]|nr:hypothetical protein [Campylobacterota bacterium]